MGMALLLQGDPADQVAMEDRLEEVLQEAVGIVVILNVKVRVDTMTGNRSGYECEVPTRRDGEV